jgi:hypothetical protein
MPHDPDHDESRPPLVRRMVARDPHEPQRVSTSLELLFVAVTGGRASDPPDASRGVSERRERW